MQSGKVEILKSHAIQTFQDAINACTSKIPLITSLKETLSTTKNLENYIDLLSDHICMDGLLSNPVVLTCNHCFEKNAIIEWLEKNPKHGCPECRTIFSKDEIQENGEIKNIIALFIKAYIDELDSDLFTVKHIPLLINTIPLAELQKKFTLSEIFLSGVTQAFQNKDEDLLRLVLSLENENNELASLKIIQHIKDQLNWEVGVNLLTEKYQLNPNEIKFYAKLYSIKNTNSKVIKNLQENFAQAEPSITNAINDLSCPVTQNIMSTPITLMCSQGNDNHSLDKTSYIKMYLENPKHPPNCPLCRHMDEGDIFHLIEGDEDIDKDLQHLIRLFVQAYINKIDVACLAVGHIPYLYEKGANEKIENILESALTQENLDETSLKSLYSCIRACPGLLEYKNLLEYKHPQTNECLIEIFIKNNLADIFEFLSDEKVKDYAKKRYTNEKTLLHIAVEHKNIDAICSLLSINEEQLYLKDANNNYPYTLATSQIRDEILYGPNTCEKLLEKDPYNIHLHAINQSYKLVKSHEEKDRYIDRIIKLGFIADPKLSVDDKIKQMTFEQLKQVTSEPDFWKGIIEKQEQQVSLINHKQTKEMIDNLCNGKICSTKVNKQKPLHEFELQFSFTLFKNPHNKSDVLKQFRYAALSHYNKILNGLSDNATKIKALKNIRNTPLFAQHRSTGFFKTIGRTNAQILIDKQIKQLTKSSI